VIYRLLEWLYRMRALLAFSWRRASRPRKALVLATPFVAVLLVPFLIWGEQWGMIWFYLAWPWSSTLKSVWDSDIPWVYVLLATALQSGFVYSVLWFAMRSPVASSNNRRA